MILGRSFLNHRSMLMNSARGPMKSIKYLWRSSVPHDHSCEQYLSLSPSPSWFKATVFKPCIRDLHKKTCLNIDKNSQGPSVSKPHCEALEALQRWSVQRLDSQSLLLTNYRLKIRDKASLLQVIGLGKQGLDGNY